MTTSKQVMTDERALLVPLGQLIPGPNSRTDWQEHDEEFRRLTQSIRDLGILEPLVVREVHGRKTGYQYAIICGHRRFLAAQQLGLSVVPVRKVSASDDQCLAFSLAENIARKTIQERDIVRTIETLAETYGWSNSAITRATGLSKGWVSELLTVARTKTERQAVESGQIGISTAARVARTKEDQDVYDTLIKRVAAGERLTNEDVPRVRGLRQSAQDVQAVQNEQNGHAGVPSEPLFVPPPDTLAPPANAFDAGSVEEDAVSSGMRMILEVPPAVLQQAHELRLAAQLLARELYRCQREQGVDRRLPGQIRMDLEAARALLGGALRSFEGVALAGAVVPVG